jgi:FkbM family methyltransferase
MTHTIQDMHRYTLNEWQSHPFYQNVIDILKKNNIEYMIDLGACLGDVSNIIMEQVPTIKKIVLIEALKSNFDHLITNVRKQGVHIEYYNSCIFYGQDYVNMGTQNSNIGGFAAHYGQIANDNNDQVIHNMRTSTLEQLISDTNIDFVKVDIEGAEGNVLENSNMLQHAKFIQIEFHHHLQDPKVHMELLNKYLPEHRVLDVYYTWVGQNNTSNNLFLVKG